MTSGQPPPSPGGPLECPPILAPETRNCSGRGVCLSCTICGCETGWTGFGDFAFDAPSCAVNVQAIQGLWSILFVVHFLQIFYALYSIRERFILTGKPSRRTMAFIMLSLMILGNICFASVGLIRAVRPMTKVIGTDPLITAVFCFGSSVYWIMIHVFVYTVLDTLYTQAMIFRRKSTWMVAVNKVRLILIASAMSASVFCLMPIGMLRAKSPDEMLMLGRAHYIGLGITLFVHGVILVPIFLRQLETELKTGQDALVGSSNISASETLDTLRGRIRRFRMELFRQIVPQVVFAFTFGCWPFMQVYGSSYWLALAWISGGLGGFFIMVFTAPVVPLSKTSSSAEFDKRFVMQSTPRVFNEVIQSDPGSPLIASLRIDTGRDVGATA